MIRNIRFLLTLGILLLLFITEGFCIANERNNEPNVIDLVNDVRASEIWLHDFNSLYIRAEPKWTKTPEALAQIRLEIIKEYDVNNPDEKRFPDLRSEHKETLEYAVDRKHVRFMKDDPGNWKFLKIWDSKELKIHEKYYNQSREYYILENIIDKWTFHELFGSNFGWPRSQPHSFWWDSKNVDDLMDFYGLPGKFKFVGKQVFREIPCYVLEYDASSSLTLRWFVGQSNRLLYGIQTRRGNFVSTEHWTLNYKEVVPGGWFPMKTGWSLYERNPSGKQYLRSTCNIDVQEFRINEPLDEELFNMTFQEGVEVQDRRSGEIASYIYKTPLVGTSISSIMEGKNIDYNLEQTQGNSMLFCFFDYEQRPSRYCITELKKQAEQLMEKNVQVVLIHASKVEKNVLGKWIKDNEIVFPVKIIEDNEKQTKFNWGVRALPWLILTDKEHIVTAEGFAINELDEKIKEIGGF
jgi:hypothetical protein